MRASSDWTERRARGTSMDNSRIARRLKSSG